MGHETRIERLAANLLAARAMRSLQDAGAPEERAIAAMEPAAEAVIRYHTGVGLQCRPGDEKKSLLRRLSKRRQSLERIEADIRHNPAERAWLQRAKVTAHDKASLKSALERMQEAPGKPNDPALMTLLLALMDVFHEATGKTPGYAGPFIRAVAAGSGINALRTLQCSGRRIRAARETWDQIKAAVRQ